MPEPRYSPRHLVLAAAIIAFQPTSAHASAPATASVPAGQARAAEMAAAARAFLATLSDEQRKSASFPFDDAVQRRRWSNFPTSFVKRAGVRWGDLDERQRAALMTLLGTILSADGVQMVRDQMAADDELRLNPRGPGPGGFRGHPPRGGPGGPPPSGTTGANPLSGGPGGPPDGFGPDAPAGRPAGQPPATAAGDGGPRFRPGGGPPRGPGEFGGSGGPGPANFGSDFYYAAILGMPSPTAPWLLQFGGHHLAINATVVGGRATLSPSLTGGEPLRFTKDGRRVYIVEKEVTAAAALLASLTPEQRARAVVSRQHIDLVLGPGHDGQVLQPEGLPGSAMTAAQKALFVALVEARLGILNADDRASAMAAIRADLDRTWFAWFGPAAPLGDAYFRVTGPTVLIEYSPQDMDGDATDHAHNMYRDPTNEYGAKWTSVR